MTSACPPILSRRAAIAAGLSAGAAALCPPMSGAATASAGPLVTKAIPSSGQRLPVIGLGTNAFTARSPEDLAKRQSVLKQLPLLGGKVIDTAHIYGQSEQVIGDTLAALGTREQVFLSTKVMAQDAAAAHSQIEQSFQSLKTQRIDLLEIHNLMGIETVYPILLELKKSGRIGYLGVTTSRPDDHAALAETMRQHRYDFIQVDYSIGDRSAADQVLPLALERGTAVLINVPFGGRRGSVFSQLAERQLPPWAADIDAASWGQFFLKYVVSHPAVTCAIPGTTDVAHLEDNLAAGRGRMPDAAMRKRMEQFWDSKT